MIENGSEGTYSKEFISRKREKFHKDQIVRISKSENLGNTNKYEKGRFVGLRKIMYSFLGDSYIVKLESGKIVTKRDIMT